MAYHIPRRPSENYLFKSQYQEALENNEKTITRLATLLEDFNTENELLHKQLSALATENKLLKQKSLATYQIADKVTHSLSSTTAKRINRTERLKTSYEPVTLRKQYGSPLQNPEPSASPENFKTEKSLLGKGKLVTQQTQTDMSPSFKPIRTEPSPPRRATQTIQTSPERTQPDVSPREPQQQPSISKIDTHRNTVPGSLSVNEDSIFKGQSSAFLRSTLNQSPVQPLHTSFTRPAVLSTTLPINFNFSNVGPVTYKPFVMQRAHPAPVTSLSNVTISNPLHKRESILSRGSSSGKKKFLSLVSQSSVHSQK